MKMKVYIVFITANSTSCISFIKTWSCICDFFFLNLHFKQYADHPDTFFCKMSCGGNFQDTQIYQLLT